MRKGKKKKKAFVITALITAVLGIMVVVAVVATNAIIGDKYKHVSDMRINEVDLKNIADGSYRGEFSYAKNIYSVNVTIENHRINEILLDVDTSKSNRKYADKASALIDDVIREQSLGVDCVSGATRSSKSILKAIENALSDLS
jgi:uncharacterized protein with FMN-binding domain